MITKTRKIIISVVSLIIVIAVISTCYLISVNHTLEFTENINRFYGHVTLSGREISAGFEAYRSTEFYFFID